MKLEYFVALKYSLKEKFFFSQSSLSSLPVCLEYIPAKINGSKRIQPSAPSRLLSLTFQYEQNLSSSLCKFDYDPINAPSFDLIQLLLNGLSYHFYAWPLKKHENYDRKHSCPSGHC